MMAKKSSKYCSWNICLGLIMVYVLECFGYGFDAVQLHM